MNSERANALYREYLDANYRRTSRLFVGLMIAQWLFGVLVSLVWSPYTWVGQTASLHVHVYTAVFLGGAVSSLPCYLALTRPTAVSTRWVVPRRRCSGRHCSFTSPG